VLEEQDYAFFEVSMFADRDIFMRHHGGGIGHKGIGVDVDTSRQHRFRVRKAHGALLDIDMVSGRSGSHGDAAHSPQGDGENDPDSDLRRAEMDEPHLEHGTGPDEDVEEDVEMEIAQDVEGVDEDMDDGPYGQYDLDLGHGHELSEDDEDAQELDEGEGEPEVAQRLRFAEANGGDSDSDYEDYIDEMYAAHGFAAL
ncbi:hypothetical protein L227DRAFT_617271, partial [Lentinus tigrinus ALCF2SS1-6]